MGDNSRIEWTDASWTAIRARCTGEGGKGRLGWHCEPVSEGCCHCYSEAMNVRLGTGHPFKPGVLASGAVKLFLDENMLLQPLRWKKPRSIFVCSMTDLFADFVPDEWIDKKFSVMALTPHHTYQVLTKRVERMRQYCESVTLDRLAAAARSLPEKLKTCPAPPQWPLKNVWKGTSIENQRAADKRIRELLAVPAALRFISAEPLLGALSIKQWQHNYGCGCGWGGDNPLSYCNECGWRGDGAYYGEPCPGCKETLSDYNACPQCDGHDGDGLSFGPNSGKKIDWVVCGEESGPARRPCNVDWVRSLRDQCTATETPFFYKQAIVGSRKVSMPVLDGCTWDQMPQTFQERTRA